MIRTKRPNPILTDVSVYPMRRFTKLKKARAWIKAYQSGQRPLPAGLPFYCREAERVFCNPDYKNARYQISVFKDSGSTGQQGYWAAIIKL